MRLKKDTDTKIFSKDKTPNWVGCIHQGDSICCYIDFEGFFVRKHNILGRNRYYL